MQFKLETPEQQRTAIGSVVEPLLYPSFGAPLVLLWAPYGESEDARYIHGGFSELSWRCHGALTEVYALGNIGGVANEAGFNASRTYVQGTMNLCSIYKNDNRNMQDDNLNVLIKSK